MVVGNGQLANVFQDANLQNTCIFASGVSNSSCTSEEEFKREYDLLLSILKENKEKKFVYFSSCALSANNYPKNAYYLHKNNMEKLIKMHSKQYYIFRIPQLFGDLILHKTLINFIYKAIEHNHHFNVFSKAYRYVIEINDLRMLVEAFLKNSNSCVTLDIANPYRYSVIEIVKIFEKLLNKRANYTLIDKNDQYELELYQMKDFIESNNIMLDFGEEYLINKLKDKIR